MGSEDLLAFRWDQEYRQGRYAHEPPIAFAGTVAATLARHPSVRNGVGLYVGCGNGRNYLPLLDLGLNLYGLDVSPEAIRHLTEHRPAEASRLIHEDFRRFRGDNAFSYVIAIQVFQHGDTADAEAYFDKVAGVLHRDGFFFLRVNSAATEVYHRHTVVERNGFGGFTVRYEEGPKRGLLVHFFSRQELLERTQSSFSPLIELHEDVIRRSSPKTGCWAQWEAVWQRT